MPIKKFHLFLLSFLFLAARTQQMPQATYDIIPLPKEVQLNDARSIEVNELQESAWKSFFGERHTDAYHYFQENFNTGLSLNDQTQCETLYDEFLKSRLRLL